MTDHDKQQTPSPSRHVVGAGMRDGPDQGVPDADKALLQRLASMHPDDIAVEAFSIAMKAKLARKRDEGRSGWDDPTRCSLDTLSAMLLAHVAKGDPVDVANFAMMIHQRGGRITLTPAPAEPETESADPERVYFRFVRGDAFGHEANRLRIRKWDTKPFDGASQYVFSPAHHAAGRREAARHEAVRLIERAGLEMEEEYDLLVDDISETMLRFASVHEGQTVQVPIELLKRIWSEMYYGVGGESGIDDAIAQWNLDKVVEILSSVGALPDVDPPAPSQGETT